MPKRIPDPKDPSRKVNDYWACSVKLLGDPQLFKRLDEFLDGAAVPPARLAKLRKDYLSQPSFTYENAMKVSMAASALFLWLKAVDECGGDADEK